MSTVELAYTAPPERITAGLEDGKNALEAYAAADSLAAELPATVVPEPNRDGQAERLGQVSVVHRFVDAPGDSETVRWHVVEAGDPGRPTVIFLHGVPDSWWQWHYALEGWVVSSKFTDLEAGSANLFKQTVEIAHSGLQRVL